MSNGVILPIAYYSLVKAVVLKILSAKCIKLLKFKGHLLGNNV